MGNPKTEIPDYLESTYKMITAAYPNGIDESRYLPLISLLYEYMSDRNLAEVISFCTGKDSDVVLNDVYRSQSTDKVNDDEIESVRQELLSFGFEEWSEED